MKRILIIDGNPDPSPDRLSSALARAYQEGAEGPDCMVRRINIGGIEFPILRSAEEFASSPTDKAMVEARAAFMLAEHIVFIYPLWLGGPPALLKAFMEQIARDQFLLGENKRGFPLKKMKWRSARVIVTMGMPPLIYRTLFGAHGVKSFNTGILRLAGFSPIRTSYFGGSRLQRPHSDRLIGKVRDMGRKDR
jgi:putative NADPH-quinone reductase